MAEKSSAESTDPWGVESGEWGSFRGSHQTRRGRPPPCHWSQYAIDAYLDMQYLKGRVCWLRAPSPGVAGNSRSVCIETSVARLIHQVSRLGRHAGLQAVRHHTLE